jgi:cytochrome c556
MAPDALQQVEDAQAQMIAALDRFDLAALKSANAALAEAVQHLREQDNHQDNAQDKDALDRVFRQNHAARLRTNYLANDVRQRLDALTDLRFRLRKLS